MKLKSLFAFQVTKKTILAPIGIERIAMYTLRARRVLGEWMEQFKEASMERTTVRGTPEIKVHTD